MSPPSLLARHPPHPRLNGHLHPLSQRISAAAGRGVVHGWTPLLTGASSPAVSAVASAAAASPPCRHPLLDFRLSPAAGAGAGPAETSVLSTAAQQPLRHQPQLWPCVGNFGGGSQVRGPRPGWCLSSAASHSSSTAATTEPSECSTSSSSSPLSATLTEAEAVTNRGPGSPASPSLSPTTPSISSPASLPASPEDIAARIAASRARRATRVSYHCPGCSISAATPLNIARHMERCCPDLQQPDAPSWRRLDSLPRGDPTATLHHGGEQLLLQHPSSASNQHDLVVALLGAAAAREQALRRRMLSTVFWCGPTDPDTGLPLRLGAEEVARRMGLPPARASFLLQRALAAVPLVADHPCDGHSSGGNGGDGGGLDVVWEDEHFLAVNKPVGLHTAPIHRFTGGSVVNRVIAYLNRSRGGRRHAGDGPQVTLLTPPPSSPSIGSPSVPYGYVPELLPLRPPFTLASPPSTSSSTSSSCSPASDSDSDAGPAPPADLQHPQRQLEPYVLHRLDMNTSGLLLFAKRQEVVAGVHRQFRERTLSKFYVAAAVGCPDWPDSDRFDVDAPIDRHPTESVARVVADTGKEASTSFAVLARNPAANLGPAAGGAPGLLFSHFGRASSAPTTTPTPTAAAAPATIPPGASLLVCAPHSGRTHQIRVHLAASGHPIVGDDIYGVTGPWLDRQALHAAALRFTHPLTGAAVTLAAPLHADMAVCLAALGLPSPDVGALAGAWGEQLAERKEAARGGRQRR